MRAVAVPTICRSGCAERVAHAVDAVGVFFAFLLVATGAIRRGNLGIMNQFFDAGVAIDTVELGVDGTRKAVGGEDG